MPDQAKVDQLRAVPMLAQMPFDALERLADSANEFEVTAGHVLIQQNQPSTGLLILTHGEVTVDLGAQSVTCVAGECIGELSLLLDDVVHVARVRAATDVRGFAISRDDFDRLIERDTRIAVPLLRVLARRLAETDRMIMSNP
jgi:CRP/FNR family transcriptional regulator